MNLTYSFSAADVEAITEALVVLPEYEFAEGREIPFCISAGSALINHTPLPAGDAYVIALAIDSAYKALRNEITLSDEYKEALRDYVFTNNKLEPIFSPLLDSM